MSHLFNELVMGTLCERDVVAVHLEIEDKEPNNTCIYE